MNPAQNPTSFVPHVVDLTEGPNINPDGALVLLSGHPRLVLLHSAGGSPKSFSLLGFDPVVALDERSDLRTFEDLREATAVHCDGRVPGPFAGGFLGAISYDFGAANLALNLPEDLRPEPFGQPGLVGGTFTDFLVWDHAAGTLHLVLNEARADFAQRRDEVMGELRHQEPDPADATRSFQAAQRFLRDTPPAVHTERVEQIRQAIRRGDLYQANLAHRIHGTVEGDAVHVYQALAAENNAPYMGFVSWPGGALLSASPELLLELDVDEAGQLQATTRPIKGTIQRGATPEEDRARGAELFRSVKDRAELAMIVDLERNDLGRVAVPGGVTVGEFPRLETFAAVHHLVADVTARLKPGEHAFSLLQSIFPGGSITGAPKLASMELIAKLEGEQRGFFCGALGFVDSRGGARFNILIRTILWRETGGPAEVSMRVGGGITWASEPELEDKETLHKAASLLSALGVTDLGNRT